MRRAYLCLPLAAAASLATATVAPDASAARSCEGTVVYGPSTIEVREVRHIRCRRANRLARLAVSHRVTEGSFPSSFCLHRFCWRFGEARGTQPGESRIRFRGRRGSRYIRAVQFVT